MTFFHAGELDAQHNWGTAGIWDDARKARLLLDHIPQEFHARLENAPFFFLATSAPDGRCDCSFKGGGAGLIRILDKRRFAFPDFDGNGAFMSLGNLLLNPHVGCLFIDFSDGGRLRVNGKAGILAEAESRALFPGCKRAVMVEVEQVTPNCPKHVPLLAFAHVADGSPE